MVNSCAERWTGAAAQTRAPALNWIYFPTTAKALGVCVRFFLKLSAFFPY